MSSILYELSMGWRSVTKARWISAIAILTLALGVGANSAMFSLVDSLLLRPLSIPDAEEVVILDRMDSDGRPTSIPIPKYQTWRENSRGFAQLGAYLSESFSLTGTTTPGGTGLSLTIGLVPTKGPGGIWTGAPGRSAMRLIQTSFLNSAKVMQQQVGVALLLAWTQTRTS